VLLGPSGGARPGRGTLPSGPAAAGAAGAILRAVLRPGLPVPVVVTTVARSGGGGAHSLAWGMGRRPMAPGRCDPRRSAWLARACSGPGPAATTVVLQTLVPKAPRNSAATRSLPEPHGPFVYAPNPSFILRALRQAPKLRQLETTVQVVLASTSQSQSDHWHLTTNSRGASTRQIP
jgi:hypothetical protein